jgi:hypothetical protein
MMTDKAMSTATLDTLPVRGPSISSPIKKWITYMIQEKYHDQTKINRKESHTR